MCLQRSHQNELGCAHLLGLSVGRGCLPRNRDFHDDTVDSLGDFQCETGITILALVDALPCTLSNGPYSCRTVRREGGTEIDESDEQPQNASSSICKSLEFDSNVSVERELHLLKQDSQRVSTEEGIQIDESDEQQQNAESEIHESVEFDSNVSVERELHSLKQLSQRCLTEEGIQIDESDEQQRNADSPIPKSLEFDSNVSVERELQQEKQYSQSFSTEKGIQIDESDEQPRNA
jgi:hypothetical protein